MGRKRSQFHSSSSAINTYGVYAYVIARVRKLNRHVSVKGPATAPTPFAVEITASYTALGTEKGQSALAGIHNLGIWDRYSSYTQFINRAQYHTAQMYPRLMITFPDQ